MKKSELKRVQLKGEGDRKYIDRFQINNMNAIRHQFTKTTTLQNCQWQSALRYYKEKPKVEGERED